MITVEETTKLVGQDGVEALQAFADSSQSLTNEMIVTKNGRRMFPVIKVDNFDKF